jgi:hypothetical protein
MDSRQEEINEWAQSDLGPAPHIKRETATPRPKTKQSRSQAQTQKFLFVNKNPASKTLSRSTTAEELFEIRRHVKQTTDRRHESARAEPFQVKPVSASRIAREGFALRQSPTTSYGSDSTDEISQSSSSQSSSPELEYPPAGIGHVAVRGFRDHRQLRQQRQHFPKSNLSRQNEPARFTDPFQAAPVQMNSIAQRILQYYINISKIDAPLKGPSPQDAISDTRYMIIAHQNLKKAFSSRIRLASILAATASSMAVIGKALDHRTAIWWSRKALVIIREELANQHIATHDHFFAAWTLFANEVYWGNAEAALTHLRAAHAVWRAVGGYRGIDKPSVELFLSLVFFQAFIEYWNAKPPIPPFWDPEPQDEPWPPQLPRELVSKQLYLSSSTPPSEQSSILLREDVKVFIRGIVSYAETSRDMETWSITRRLLAQHDHELGNVKLRQRLMCMQTNDQRIHILRRSLHMLASSLAGMAWVIAYLAHSTMFLKTELMQVSDMEWIGEHRVRTLCVVIATMFSPDDWFLSELARYRNEIDAERSTRATEQHLRTCCRELLGPDLIPLTALEDLSKRIEKLRALAGS